MREKECEREREVVRGTERERKRVIANGERSDISTFYFTRFLDEVTESDLWAQFKRWGDVWEIFISKHRNRGGKRYGFVRFRGVSDERTLERQLDNLVIGGLKLYVNIPKYERRRECHAQRTVEPKTQTHNRRQGVPTHRQTYDHHRVAPTSYAKALLSNTIPEPRQYPGDVGARHAGSQSSLFIDIPTGTKSWFSDAWVGRLKTMTSFDKAEDDIIWEIGDNVVPKYLGDDMILVLGLSDSKAEQLANEENMHGTTLFSSLEKWSSNIKIGHRLVWVLCWGIPLEAWDTTSIRKIVAPIGDLVEMDDDVEELRRLNRARVLVRTPWKPLRSL
ncbi:hypothetical protein JHK85_023282 [Glycine max]|uniref:RRM domain-containing protein n=1 Tax=Glycine max TaxID=3847 RepID=K7L9E2_SOYBN|nr:hypothetical protein JHK87_022691 [Glycine soja]KAG5017146.1 hypothetical protein JHK85_023282 [Glycine max]KAG5026901.1 hypothetical protein JHK86_022815 [Glycine max]KAH1053453.1 hypothetical protein GYH30_022645 [Glycine max]